MTLSKSVFFLASALSIFYPYTARSSEDPIIADGNKYQRCYLISYYAQQALLMRYHGFSRFEIMDFFNKINFQDEPESIVKVNSGILSNSEKYIDAAFDFDIFLDEKTAESEINRHKNNVYDRCMHTKY